MAKDISLTPRERKVVASALEFVAKSGEIRTLLSDYDKSSAHQTETMQVLVKHFNEEWDDSSEA